VQFVFPQEFGFVPVEAAQSAHRLFRESHLVFDELEVVVDLLVDQFLVLVDHKEQMDAVGSRKEVRAELRQVFRQLTSKLVHFAFQFEKGFDLHVLLGSQFVASQVYKYYHFGLDPLPADAALEFQQLLLVHLFDGECEQLYKRVRMEQLHEFEYGWRTRELHEDPEDLDHADRVRNVSLLVQDLPGDV